MKNFNFNNYNRKNNNIVRREKKAPLDAAVLPSMDKYASKSDAEEIKDLNVLFNLFPNDAKIRRAAEKQLKKIKNDDEMMI